MHAVANSQTRLLIRNGISGLSGLTMAALLVVKWVCDIGHWLYSVTDQIANAVIVYIDCTCSS